MRDRDVEKQYSDTENIQKLERLIECMKTRKPFEIQVAGKRIYVPVSARFTIEHEVEGTRTRSWSFSSGGRTTGIDQGSSGAPSNALIPSGRTSQGAFEPVKMCREISIPGSPLTQPRVTP